MANTETVFNRKFHFIEHTDRQITIRIRIEYGSVQRTTSGYVHQITITYGLQPRLQQLQRIQQDLIKKESTPKPTPQNPNPKPVPPKTTTGINL